MSVVSLRRLCNMGFLFVILWKVHLIPIISLDYNNLDKLFFNVFYCEQKFAEDFWLVLVERFFL